MIKIKKREDEYSLEEVEVYDFKTEKRLGNGLVAIDYLVNLDNTRKKPNKHYLELCRKSAYKIGKEFGKVWDETTYTSNGKKISDWLKRR